MGRPGSALDNAVIESWHSTLEFELRSVEQFATKAVVATTAPVGPAVTGRIPAIVATLATDGWDRIGFNG